MFISQLATRLASGTLRSRESEVPFWAWQDELARLRVWAHDIGLYKAGHTSLDERLSQIPPVKSQISRQMTRIRRLVRDIEEELSYPDQSGSMDTDTDGELEDDKVTKPTTTLQDIYTNLKDSIDVLNRMSNIEISRREIAAASLRNSRTAQQTVEGANLQQEKVSTGHGPRLKQNTDTNDLKEHGGKSPSI
jgi:hypothetical protein